MKAPKFISNEDDNNHCLQASVWMAFGGRINWSEVNEMTDYQEGLYSWMSAAVVAISKKISGTKFFSGLDYEQFAQRGAPYLKEFWPDFWYNTQKILASEGFKKEQSAAKNILDDSVLFIHKIPKKAEIEEMLSDGNLLIALVNTNQLAGEEGVAGHFVLLFHQDTDYFTLHDPGLPPRKKYRVTKKTFMQAFLGELLVIPQSS